MIGAVGFMNQRLEIPKDVDPQWVSIIESCWHRFVTFICFLIDLASSFEDKNQYPPPGTKSAMVS